MTTDTTLHLGEDWRSAEQIITLTLWFVPRIGELIEYRHGVDDPRPMRVIDVKHTLIDDLQLIELLIWPDGGG